MVSSIAPLRLLAGAWARFGRAICLLGAVLSLATPIPVGVVLEALPSPVHAQALTGNCWATGLLPQDGGSACYSTAYQACYRQWQEYQNSGTFEGFTSVGSNEADLLTCQWSYSFPFTAPSQIRWFCSNGAPPNSGQACPGDNLPTPTGLSCSANGSGTATPTTPRPIDILSGDKEFEVSDFTSANNSLSLNRVYSSMPLSGGASTPLASPLGLANWHFDFEYELQISYGWSSGNILTVVTPQGAVLTFQRQSDGSLAPVANPNYVQPQTDYTLAIVGSWPTNLATLNQASTEWTLVDANDTTWTLETFADPVTGLYSVARPIQMVRSDGLQLTFGYTTPYQLQTITDSYGNQISFTWLVDDYTSAGGNKYARAISSVSLPGGYSIAYNYSTIGSFPASGPQPDVLSQVQYLSPTGAVLDQVSYQYGNANFPYAVTGVLDSNGVQRWSVTYDSVGRALSSSGPGGAEAYSVSYGSMASPGGTFTRTVTNPLGRQTIYTYSLSGSNQLALSSVDGQATTNCPASAASYTYAASGLIASRTDENGNVTTYTRDPRGMPDTVTQASGTSSARTITTTWHSNARLPSAVAAPGVTTTYTYVH